MPPSSFGRSHTIGHRSVVPALGCALGALALVGCGGGGQNTGSSPRPTPSSPNAASFPGMPPSALASSAASAIASAHASASAAASSAAARASEFEASVDAEAARAGAAAEKALKNVQGRGNALAEVSLMGIPRSQTSGLLAALVTITNKTHQKASYAAQVDFADSAGKVVETRFVGAEKLEPGHTEQPIAFSRHPQSAHLTARLAKAQRY
jgi:hypothetical protein